MIIINSRKIDVVVKSSFEIIIYKRNKKLQKKEWSITVV